MSESNTDQGTSNPSNTLDGDAKHPHLNNWAQIKKFFANLLDIRKDSSAEETIDSVRSDISFQGHNAWILVFSIMVASVGLNANSTPVVIGAMLISPLMGPIVGLGLSMAINDGHMLRRSVINLFVMVGLSLITAMLYFSITPLSEFTAELEARTYPTILDVLVAIFGGLALIVAKAKKGTISNAIAGVAIATALMPPLCTAGYGLAEGRWSVFGGAMYLFSINTVFIGLSTFIVCKFLRFPMKEYATKAKRKLVSIIATVVGIAVLAPSVYLFYQLYKEQVYTNLSNEFVVEQIRYEGTRTDLTVNYGKKQLEIVLMGAPVPEYKIQEWKSNFQSNSYFKNSEIKFFQSGNFVENGDIDKVQDDLIQSIRQLQSRNDKIFALENALKKQRSQTRSFESLKKEMALLFPELETVTYSPSIMENLKEKKTDSISIFSLKFDKSVSVKSQEEKSRVIDKWLRYRLAVDTLVVKNAM